MKREHLALSHKKICPALHPDWLLAASDNVAAVTQQNIWPLTFDNRKETTMQEMTNFTHPIELSDKELDLVAAGWSNGGGGSCNCKGSSGSRVDQIGVINLNNVLNNDSILSGNTVAVAIL
jgi:hypothetical protein